MTGAGRRRWPGRALLVAGTVMALAASLALVDGCQAFGGRAHGQRLARMQRSPQWRDGSFRNPQPLQNSFRGVISGAWHASDHTGPTGALPVVTGDRKHWASPPGSGLRVTWLGHSSLLIEIDGYRLLTDPVWGARASPFGWVGPRRWYPPPFALGELPVLDAVLISHDHYDHLDQQTIAAMKDWKTRFIVPLGVGAHLLRWGIPEGRIVEVDWWDAVPIRELSIVCTPARHASGRVLFDNDGKLWAGYALIGPTHRAYFSGDTGLFPALREIGARLGPFDLTMIEAGQYDRAWPDWHIGPEQAVVAHQMVRGRTMLPIHWGLFSLAYHGWTEPIERVLVAARRAGVPLIVPRPGQSIEPSAPPPLQRWWPDLPWKTAEEHPIVSTGMN
jgi:L-ascorbate metabolism protein UlaG (beta-lactamase superfamily)